MVDFESNCRIVFEKTKTFVTDFAVRMRLISRGSVKLNALLSYSDILIKSVPTPMKTRLVCAA